MKKPYVIQPVTMDDADAVMAVGTPAFLHDALVRATFPPELVDPANPDEQIEWRLRRFRGRVASQSGVMHKILADDGSIAGFAGWVAPQKDVDDDGDTRVEDAANPTGEVPKCARKELFEAQIRQMKETKERVLGTTKNYWYLSSLATHPDHQGKGIGAALVRWGIEQGEKDGVPVYLEATPHGAFLYKKLGFETADEIDMSKWIPNGGEYKVLAMLKMPSVKAQ